jgi:hypothetical protein
MLSKRVSDDAVIAETPDDLGRRLTPLSRRQVIEDFRRYAAFAQASQYIGAGLWPLISMGTFQAVTGPKVDRWLVRTVGILVAVNGCVIGLAAMRRRLTPEIVLLAAGSAAGLGAIDVWYALRGRISKVYLADAIIQGLFLAAWIRSLRR